MRIRAYTSADYAEVASWWRAAGEPAPTPGMLPTGSTFIMEHEGTPMLCVSAYLTNTPEAGYLENFAGNPIMKGELRRRGAHELIAFASQWAREKGVKRLVVFTEKEALKRRYEELGGRRTVDNLSAFVIPLE